MAERGPPRAVTPALMHGWLNDDLGVFVRSVRELERFESSHQRLEVHETAQFGRLYRLDGAFMASEKDEFFYHENLVHIAAMAHPAPKHALVVGGGDGGSAEELLKHPTIEAVTVVELDLAVVDIARKHFSSVHRGALADSRVTLKLQDGFAFMRESDAAFDLLVLDLTGPEGPAEALYTAAFYRACAARLTSLGAMTLHIGSPIARPDHVRAVIDALRDAFPVVAPYLVSIPLYGGLWMMACASNALDPRALTIREIDRRIATRVVGHLSYYNGDTHRAAFALPNFVRRMLA